MVALVALQPVIRLMDESDPETMSAAFTVLGWYKATALYQRYLAEQEEGWRLAFLAEWRGEFAGYVTLLWVSDYRPFAERQIPEISDLNVLPPHRRHGLGNALLDRAESAASARSKVVGLGVGLYSDYGAAQRIYARRGYLPDGRGIMYRNQPVEPGATIRIDDDAALMLTRPVGLRSPPGHPRGGTPRTAMGNALTPWRGPSSGRPPSVQNRVICARCGHYLGLPRDRKYSAIRAPRLVRDIPARSLAVAMVNRSYRTTMPIGRDPATRTKPRTNDARSRQTQRDVPGH